MEPMTESPADGDLPYVSVIIPTFNCGAFLPVALASLRAQEWPRLEVIVIDDGSTDGTAELLAPMAERGELVFLQRTNSGPSAARNAGIRAASGAYVVFLDADDSWEPGAFRAIWSAMKAAPGCGWCLLDVVRAYPDRDELRPCPVPAGDPVLAILEDNYVHGRGFFLRQALLDVGLFDESFRIFEDWDLFIRLSLAGIAAAYAPGPWYRYLVRGDSITRNHRLLVESRERLIRKHHGRLARSGGAGLRNVYAHQLWKLAREYHYALGRPGRAFLLLAESVRWHFAPEKLVRVLGGSRRAGG
jgi:glycosyltransferase involved in cell wall biosynthesis